MKDENLTEKTERPHHPWSPSQLQNMEACPCYQGRQGGSEAATLGTKQHGVTESGVDNASLDDDRVAAAADCIDFFERQKQLLIEARAQDVLLLAREEAARFKAPWAATLEQMEKSVPTVQEFNEIYLEVDDLVYRAPVFDYDTGGFENQWLTSTTGGYIDKGLLDHTGQYAELFDWKFGAWPVEGAANNVQGICYVLGFFRKFPACHTIKFFFKQPALDSVSFHVFYREQAPALYLRVKTIVARKIEANKAGDFSMATPYVPVCNFCARLGRCDKVCAAACKVASKFYPMEIPENVTPSYVQEPKQTALALRLAGVMSVWAEAFRHCVSDRVIRREAELPPGFTIATRSDREIADKAKFLAITRKYVTEAELAEQASYTFGGIEGVISEKAPRGMKKATLEEYKQTLESSGAVTRGAEYSFLRAIPTKKTE